MSSLQTTFHPEVSAVFERYPEKARKLAQLRTLILSVAEEMHNISSLEETCIGRTQLQDHDWGVRCESIETEEATPMWYVLSMYQQTHSHLSNPLPKGIEFWRLARHLITLRTHRYQKEVLKPCIQTALQYHKVKHLLMLGLFLVEVLSMASKAVLAFCIFTQKQLWRRSIPLFSTWAGYSSTGAPNTYSWKNFGATVKKWIGSSTKSALGTGTSTKMPAIPCQGHGRTHSPLSRIWSTDSHVLWALARDIGSCPRWYRGHPQSLGRP